MSLVEREGIGSVVSWVRPEAGAVFCCVVFIVAFLGSRCGQTTCDFVKGHLQRDADPRAFLQWDSSEKLDDIIFITAM